MTTDSGVSPVIGVLLMLTLTLIIAAIVNSFAGGLVDTKDKPPAATLQASFFQGQNMDYHWNLTINHVSGDPLPTSGVSLILRPSRTFGGDAGNSFIEIDKLRIRNSTGSNYQTWANGISSMKAGDTHVIFGNKDDITDIEPSGIDILADNSIGNTFYLEFYYDRNLIAKSEVLIQP